MFSFAIACSMELISEESTETTKTTNYKCSKCNLEYSTKDTTLIDISTECYRYYENINTYKNVDGKDIVIKSTGIEEKHSGIWNEYDLTAYGACGGKLNICECSVCGEFVNFFVDHSSCNMVTNSTSSEYKTYADIKCTECGFRRFSSNRHTVDKDDPCVLESEIHYLLEIGDVQLVNEIQRIKYNNCDYLVSVKNEVTNCNDGVVYEYSCQKCDEVLMGKMYGHFNVFTEQIDISDTECCSNTLRKVTCACGEIGNIYSDHCDFIPMPSTSFNDEYGMPHIIIPDKCAACGITKETEDYYVDGGDVYEYHRDYAIYFDKEEVLASYESIIQYVSK